MKPRDIIWLNKIYGEWIKPNENLAKDDDDDISDSELEIGSSKNSLQQKEKPNDMD
jgi:hypothetical protein